MPRLFRIVCEDKNISEDECLQSFAQHLRSFMIQHGYLKKKTLREVEQTVRRACFCLTKQGTTWNNAPQFLEQRLRLSLGLRIPKAVWDKFFARAHKKYRFLYIDAKSTPSADEIVKDEVEKTDGTFRDYVVLDLDSEPPSDVVELLPDGVRDTYTNLWRRLVLLASKAKAGGLTRSEQQEMGMIIKALKELPAVVTDIGITDNVEAEIKNALGFAPLEDFFARITKLLRGYLPEAKDVIIEELLQLWQWYKTYETKKSTAYVGISRENLEEILRVAYNIESVDDLEKKLRDEGYIDENGEFTPKVLELDVTSKVEALLAKIREDS